MEPAAPNVIRGTPPDSDQSTTPARTPDPQRSFGSLSANELVAYVIAENARHHEQLTAALRVAAAERERAERAERALCFCTIS